MKFSSENLKKDGGTTLSECVVPVASDGSWFGPHLARSGDKFTLGPKGKEIQVKGFEHALDMLKKMPVAQWRRPNNKGNWGIVTATGEWQKLGDLVDKNEFQQKEQEVPVPSIPLQDTDIGKIYERIKDLYAQRTLAAAIKDEALVDLVLEILSATADASEIEKLCAASALGYLYAAPSVKNRAEVVYGPVKTLFTSAPPPLSTLNLEGAEDNALRRRRAAEALAHAEGDWLLDYFVTSAITEESNSDLPREQLISNILDEKGDLTALFEAFRDKISLVKSIDDVEQRFTRVRRFFDSLEKVVTGWSGSCGAAPGESLADLFAVAHRSVSESARKEDRYGAADSAQLILGRVIELRFSFALAADTFSLMSAIESSMGEGRWVDYLSSSDVIDQTRSVLLEAVLVLVRQGKEDSAFADLLVRVFGGRAAANTAVAAYLADFEDLDPETKDWWEKTGKVPVKRRGVVQRDDITVDQQIGELLIHIEDAEGSMQQLGKTIVPALEISDPILADTASKASAGYGEIAQVVRQMGRSRKLTLTGNKGARDVDYSRVRHEMLGGHRPGVRKVRVLRNGVIKDFGGTKRIIIKEWVESED